MPVRRAAPQLTRSVHFSFATVRLTREAGAALGRIN